MMVDGGGSEMGARSLIQVAERERMPELFLLMDHLKLALPIVMNLTGIRLLPDKG